MNEITMSNFSLLKKCSQKFCNYEKQKKVELRFNLLQNTVSTIMSHTVGLNPKWVSCQAGIIKGYGFHKLKYRRVGYVLQRGFQNYKYFAQVC